MGYIGNEIGPHGLNTSQLRHHFVEIQEHQIQIVMVVAGVKGRDVDGKIPLRHLICGPRQFLHGPVVGFYDFMAGKYGQPRRHQRPVNHRDGDLNQRIPLVLIDQSDQPRMDTGHQKQDSQINGKQRRRKTGLQPFLFPPCHFSTALYPSPRIVFISKSLQAEHLSRSFVIYTSTARSPVSLSTPQNSSISWDRENAWLG